MNYRSKFIVKPGSAVNLDKIDPDYTGDFTGKTAKDEAKEKLKANGERLNEQQTRLFASGTRALTIKLQAPDTAGKDGIISHVFGFFNPQGMTVTSFKAPTAIELGHHFQWRAEMSEPAKGQISVYNRSEYEDTLIVRVRNLISGQRWSEHFAEYLQGRFGNKKTLLRAAAEVDFKSLIDEYGLRDPEEVKQAYAAPAVAKLREALSRYGATLEDTVAEGTTAFWQNRFDEINAYEQARARHGLTTLKFYLHISREEQLSRLWERVNDPQKNWKVTKADFSERKFWDAYHRAYESMLSATSTKHAPWFIIPANKKWFSRFAVSEITASAMESLGLEYPKSEVNIDEIKRDNFGITKEGDKPRFDLV